MSHVLGRVLIRRIVIDSDIERVINHVDRSSIITLVCLYPLIATTTTLCSLLRFRLTTKIRRVLNVHANRIRRLMYTDSVPQSLLLLSVLRLLQVLALICL